MAKNEDELMQIEFETSLESSVSAPELVSSSQRSAALPMAMVVLVVGGLLVALAWFSSTTDSAVLPEDAASGEAEPEAEHVAEESALEDSIDSEPERDSVIPELSSALIALDPVPLIDPSFATVFDGQLFAVANGSTADELVSPSVLRTPDGVNWEDLPAIATSGGIANTVGYSWADIRSAGDGLTATAIDFDRARLSFVSSNGVDWEQVRTEDTFDAGKILFETLSVTEDSVVGLSLGGSEALARFVEDHTIAVDVTDACFVSSRAVVGCDETTEWPFTEETIDSSFGSEAVFSCLNRLSVLGPNISLFRIAREGSEVDPLDLRIYLTQFLPSALGDGRVAGVDALAFFGDPDACDGLAEVEEADADPFYVFDPGTGVVERAALHPELNPSSTELLGAVDLAGSDTFLFRSNGQLWALDFESGVWTMLDVSLFGEQVTLADSGDRLYSFGGGDLNVYDLVPTAQGIEVIETTVYVLLPTDWTFSFIQSAGAEQIIFQTDGSSWFLEVPRGLRCAEQYADAIAGNGLVEDC